MITAKVNPGHNRSYAVGLDDNGKSVTFYVWVIPTKAGFLSRKTQQ